MIYPLLILIVIALLSLMIIGFKRPECLRSQSFPFTRKCLGIAIVTYGASLIFLQCIPWEDDLIGFVIISQIPSWLSIILVFRGVFELLALSGSGKN